MKIKKVLVRAATDIAISATEYTAAVSTIGASAVWFYITATNANQLASGTVTQSSFDNGTTWQSTSTSTSTSGFVASATSGTSSAITLPLNTGGIITGPEMMSMASTSVASAFPLCRVPLMRLKLTNGAAQITGLAVTAFVLYMGEEPVMVVGEGNLGPS